jgi:hypothetical protein
MEEARLIHTKKATIEKFIEKDERPVANMTSSY